MLNKPHDIVIIFAIISTVVITMGFAVTEIADLGAETKDTTFFSNVEGNVTSTTGLAGTGSEATDLIDPSGDPLQSEPTEESIITQGLQSLKSIAGTYKSIENVMKDGSTFLGLDAIYWQIAMWTLIIIMFVLIYTWARGR